MYEEERKQIKRMSGRIIDNFERLRYETKQRRLQQLYLSDWIMERNR